MTTWQIVLSCWFAYGVGFVSGAVWRSIFEKDSPLTSEFIEEGDEK